ncbi:hypothetical protein [Calothrix sp. NIES-3974]|nr:hypothetical protein [Calothrix sp. NIES-3974]BAZ06587.1 hypothetical protein NIES3974_32480 [Calothrix sp. NIES-3974]
MQQLKDVETLRQKFRDRFGGLDSYSTFEVNEVHLLLVHQKLK